MNVPVETENAKHLPLCRRPESCGPAHLLQKQNASVAHHVASERNRLRATALTDR